MPNQGCLTADAGEVLLAYVDGTLEPGQAEALERHAAGCAACRELIEGQRAVWSALDAWEAPELSPEFNRNLHAAVAAEASQRGWRAQAAWLASVFTPKRLLIPASALALLVATVLLTQVPRGQTQDAVDQKAAVETEVNQMESTLDDLDVLYTIEAVLSSEERL